MRMGVGRGHMIVVFLAVKAFGQDLVYTRYVLPPHGDVDVIIPRYETVMPHGTYGGAEVHVEFDSIFLEDGFHVFVHFEEG